MPYRVVWTDKAAADVESVLNWLCSQHAQQAAEKWTAQLSAKLGLLEQHPQRYPVAPESAAIGREIRETSVGRRRQKHRVLFLVDCRTVIVLRVWHSSRHDPSREELS